MLDRLTLMARKSTRLAARPLDGASLAYLIILPVGVNGADVADALAFAAAARCLPVSITRTPGSVVVDFGADLALDAQPIARGAVRAALLALAAR